MSRLNIAIDPNEAAIEDAVDAECNQINAECRAYAVEVLCEHALDAVLAGNDNQAILALRAALLMATDIRQLAVESR
jgi:hypothetical protein